MSLATLCTSPRRWTLGQRFVHLRPMRADDYQRVLALWERCECPLRLPADSFAGIAAFLERNPGLSVIAERGGELIAAALCSEDGRAGYIHNLVVQPGHDERGVDRAIIRRCLLHLRALGITTCHLLSETHHPSVELGAHAAAGLNDSIESLASEATEVR